MARRGARPWLPGVPTRTATSPSAGDVGLGAGHLAPPPPCTAGGPRGHLSSRMRCQSVESCPHAGGGCSGGRGSGRHLPGRMCSLPWLWPFQGRTVHRPGPSLQRRQCCLPGKAAVCRAGAVPATPREEHGAGEGAGRARPGGHRGMGNRGRRGALAPGAAVADVEGASRGFWGLVPRPREGPSWPPCACSQGLGEVACAGVSVGLSQLSLPSQGPGFELHVGLPGQWGFCLPNQSITKAWLREDVSIFRRKGCLDSRDVNTQGHGRSFPSAYQGLGSTGQLSASSVPSSLRVGADFPPWGRSAQ